MKAHTLIYFSFFNYTTADFVPSELSGVKAVDIHHIDPRKKGSTELLDRIENLIALSREEHNKYGDKKQYKAMLYRRHKEVLDALCKEYDKEWLDAQIEKYKQFEITEA